MTILPHLHSHSFPLKGGNLFVHSTHTKDELGNAFHVAQRINPKRPFLFVSKTLGRHIPVSPSVMRTSYQALAKKIPSDLPSPVVVLGMAETAVGLGAGVYQEMKHHYPESLYITSTRVDIDAEPLCHFSEDHSHATKHTIYSPQSEELKERLHQARTVILVDDEATTGNTFTHAFEALRPHTQAEHLILVSLTDWSTAAPLFFEDITLRRVSLLSGIWTWESVNNESDNGQQPPLTVASTPTFCAPTVAKANWGRIGMDQIPASFGQYITAQPNERVLVLGVNEFVFTPFLLAERLEKSGATVLFSSTTRSPILVDPTNALGGIMSSVCFTDPYGNGFANFAYNVNQQQVDRILICTEIDEKSDDITHNAGLLHLAEQIKTHHINKHLRIEIVHCG